MPYAPGTIASRGVRYNTKDRAGPCGWRLCLTGNPLFYSSHPNAVPWWLYFGLIPELLLQNNSADCGHGEKVRCETEAKVRRSTEEGDAFSAER